MNECRGENVRHYSVEGKRENLKSLKTLLQNLKILNFFYEFILLRCKIQSYLCPICGWGFPVYERSKEYEGSEMKCSETGGEDMKGHYVG